MGQALPFILTIGETLRGKWQLLTRPQFCILSATSSFGARQRTLVVAKININVLSCRNLACIFLDLLKSREYYSLLSGRSERRELEHHDISGGKQFPADKMFHPLRRSCKGVLKYNPAS